MITSIILKCTESPFEITIPGEGITIFVGPNNSGKSLVLREIESAIANQSTDESRYIVKEFELVWPTRNEVEQDILKYEKMRPVGMAADHSLIGRFDPNGSFDSVYVQRNSLLSNIESRTNKEWLGQNYFKFKLIRLDGRTRFDLTNDKDIGDLLNPPTNVLAHLFHDDELRAEVRNVILDAFGNYFVIDPLNGGKLRIRLSPSPPGDDEQSLNKDAREFHKNAVYIKKSSDGVQAFVGIITATLSGEYRGILIDEPEAFLHPPLARKLGKNLASLAIKRKGSLFASTHSADFLIGCIQGSNAVKVVRLEYYNGKSKVRFVDSSKLDKIFKTPLLRSANVISSLFHDGVVVTESDNDRAFYSEIYYRISEKQVGMPSILFINAQNKQTIPEIIEPLRGFGIPAAAVVDIDIIKDGGNVWTRWLKSAHVPSALQYGYGNQRDAIKNCFSNSGKNMKSDGGIDALDAGDRAAANDLFDILESYGVFVVRKGELETWLPTLAVTGKKTDWTVSMLDRLGSDPSSSNYVLPDTGDVWDFVGKIVAWIRDPGRKGVD